MAGHGAEETESAVDIDMVIVERLLAGFTDGLGGDGLDVG